MFVHDLLIILNIIIHILFGYFDVYVIQCITIKGDMNTAQTIVIDLINENIFP